MKNKELYKYKYERREGYSIWFGEHEETAILGGIVCGYNKEGVILLVTHGKGDYELTYDDVIPDEKDLNNELGYIVHDLDGIEFLDD